MPLLDEVGNTGTLAPAQIVSEVPKPNTGVALVITFTVRLAVVPHWFAFGVKVYVPEV